MAQLGPRVVVSAIGSGAGKTTVATGLMAAFRRRGLRVASAKVGPDFIDPGYHAVATGRPGRSLDAWLSGDDLIAPLAADAGEGADILIVEGVMGMFDGSGQPGVDGSTADVARRLAAPVVAVVDVWTMAQSVAAVVHGLRTFDPTVHLAGVVLNRVAGDGHETLCREALEPLGLPVLGVIGYDPALEWRERHLGLVPVVEHRSDVAAAVARIGELVERACDLEAMLAVARAAPTTAVAPLPSAALAGRIRLGVATGPAFDFVYPENLALFEQAGAELAPFDPLTDRALPDGCDALYLGGGFPEVFTDELAANEPLKRAVHDAVAGGMPTWAECGGLLWLCRSLDGRPMVGVVEARASMTDRLTIGYRQAVTTAPSPLGPAGTVLRGHEFHRSATDPAGDALEIEARFGSGRAGFVSPSLFASYLHQHLSAMPEVAETFVATAARFAGGAADVVTSPANPAGQRSPV